MKGRWWDWLPLSPRTEGYLNSVILIVVAIMLATAIAGLVDDPDALEPGDIVIISGRDDSIGGQREKLVNEWNELHPHNKARIVELSGHADAQRAEMLARAQSGAGGVDIYNLDVTWTAEFADARYIRRLDASRIDTGSFLDRPLETCRYGGELWALPFNTDVGLLYYRSDLVTEPPREWETLEQQVIAARADGSNAADSYVSQLADYEGLTVNALEAIEGAGGELVDETGQVVYEDEKDEVTAGLERLRRISPPGAAGLDEQESTEVFRSGKALYMRNWPVVYWVLSRNLEGAPTVSFNVDPLPEGGVLGGQNLAVAAGSTKPRAAQALIEFLTSERSQQVLFQRGGLPPTREVVYTDGEFLGADAPFLTTLKTALDHAILRPVQPHYARFSEVVRTAVDGFLQPDGQLPPDFQDQLEAALKGQVR